MWPTCHKYWQFTNASLLSEKEIQQGDCTSTWWRQATWLTRLNDLEQISTKETTLAKSWHLSNMEKSKCTFRSIKVGNSRPPSYNTQFSKEKKRSCYAEHCFNMSPASIGWEWGCIISSSQVWVSLWGRHSLSLISFRCRNSKFPGASRFQPKPHPWQQEKRVSENLRTLVPLSRLGEEPHRPLSPLPLKPSIWPGPLRWVPGNFKSRTSGETREIGWAAGQWQPRHYPHRFHLESDHSGPSSPPSLSTCTRESPGWSLDWLNQD